MSDAPESSSRTPATWLQHGQSLEAAGQFDDAVAAYDRSIAALSGNLATLEVSDRRLLGLAWMNRGNALQKTGSTPRLGEAVRAYDEAIAIFQLLPLEAEPAFRNHLGAAWMNRGHALIMIADPTAADSFEQAIAQLQKLPLEADPYFRLNLAGAWTNLAHALLAPTEISARERSRVAARHAIEVLASVESAHEAFAAMSLRARRAHVMAIGDLLMEAEKKREPIGELASEATDAIDDGLTLAREFETRGVTQLRSLAARLFRMGVHLYGVHQPQFLGEFVLENLAAPALAADAEFRAIATDALAATLAQLQRQQLFVAGMSEAEKMIATARSLRTAQEHLSTLVPQLATSPSPA